MAAAFHQIPLRSLGMVKAAAETVSYTDDNRTMDRAMCKLAGEMFRLAGRGTSPLRIMFVKMAHAEKWDPRLQDVVDTVYEVAGDHWLGRIKQASEGFNKAAGIGSIVANLGRFGFNVAPEVAKMIPLLAVAGGAGSGALWWLANRHADEDDSNTAALKAKVDYYRSITDEITDELNRKGIIKDPVDTGAARANATDAIKDTQLYA